MIGYLCMFIKKVFCYCLTGIAVFFILAALISTLAERPTFFSIIQSNSMYPILSRGDIVLTRPISVANDLSVGDIILFKPKYTSYADDWIIHQITGGNDTEGYFTKGVANSQLDQDNNDFPLIKREWIASKAITYKGCTIKAPLLGFPLLWLNDAKDWVLIIPLLCLAIIVIVIIDILLSRANFISFYNRNLLVFSGGFFLSLLLACYTVTSSQLWLIDYNSANALPSEKTLSRVYNKWPFPLLLASNTSDQDLNLVFPDNILSPKQALYPRLLVNEPHKNTSSSSVWIATFLPLFPANWAIYLTRISFGLALIILSAIPGLPLMLFPLFVQLFSKSK